MVEGARRDQVTMTIDDEAIRFSGLIWFRAWALSVGIISMHVYMKYLIESVFSEMHFRKTFDFVKYSIFKRTFSRRTERCQNILTFSFFFSQNKDEKHFQPTVRQRFQDLPQSDLFQPQTLPVNEIRISHFSSTVELFSSPQVC